MRRGAKSAKNKVEAKPPIARKPRKSEVSRLHDLEKRLAEALEQQTATSEILRVISNSPTNIQPVLDTLAETAARLCKAYDVSIRRVDGDVLRLAAHHGPIPQAVDVIPVIRGTTGGRSVLDRQTIHIADAQAETGEFPEGSALARQLGHRTILTVPLLREGLAIGTINLRRTEVRPFTDAQIALLETFADQAVIAIENVRLFKETKEALEQQTATAEILRVISSSPTGVQPTFEAIARAATSLCEVDLSGIYPFDGDLIHFGAQHGRTPDEVDAARQAFPQPPSRLSVTARAILASAVV
jgi:putative methionine-R-sulfoxide reductase with GAF domain